MRTDDSVSGGRRKENKLARECVSSIGVIHMRAGKTLTILFFLLLCGVGLAAGSVFLWRRITCPVSGNTGPGRGALQFEPCLAGLSTADDGSPTSFTRFRSSTGIPVELRVERRASPELARKALEDRLKRAVAVLQRGPLRDAAGKLVGERVLAVFPGPWEAVVLATDGSRLHSVQSPSIRHVLEFERRSDQ